MRSHSQGRAGEIEPYGAEQAQAARSSASVPTLACGPWSVWAAAEDANEIGAKLRGAMHGDLLVRLPVGGVACLQLAGVLLSRLIGGAHVCL